MPHFPQERDILKRQITNRLAEIEATIYQNRLAIGEWETVIAGAKRDAENIPETGWEPFEIETTSGQRPDGLGRIPTTDFTEWHLGTQWGWWDRSQWFRTTVTVPVEMKGSPVVALLTPGSEALCYVNGHPTQGLDPNRSEVMLTDCAVGGETFEIVLDASATANMYDDKPIRTFLTPYLATKDNVAWDFWWDIKVGMSVVAALPDGAEKQRFDDLIDQSVKLIDLNRIGDLDRYHADLEKARKTYLRGRKQFEKSTDMGTVFNVGHSHIDTAWLWPLRETRKKCSRTFSTVLKYMEQYPHYTFTQGQPQLYEWIKEQFPDIWEGIKKRVKEGRWEATGGSWVEQDSMVAGAEALVRQYLYGRRFFRNELGVESTVAWLPDAFGFPVTMPQILAKSGIRCFGTTKINWSQYNPFPYSLFRWRGLDGTELMSFMPPGAYNGVVQAGNAKGIWNSYRQKDISDEVLNTYGHGDGGGGPTQEMLENLSRLDDMGGLPKMVVGDLEAYVDQTQKNTDWDELPIYNEELYLELHRACQTTQARTKRNNRKGELMLRDAEALSAIAMLAGHKYPQERIYGAWKPLLCNQFHDILPGSSVNEVYATADKDYAEVLDVAGNVRSEALAALDEAVDTTGEGTPVVVRNTLGWVRTDAAIIPADDLAADVHVADAAGVVVPSQTVEDIEGSKSLLFEVHDVPTMGHSVYHIQSGAEPVKNSLKVSRTKLENDFFVVKLTNKGTIRSVFDKSAGREAIAEGAEANDLQLFDDRPHAHDAWDTDFNIDENRWSMDDVVSMDVVETGPVRATVRVTKQTEDSTLTQDISVWRSIPRIDFATTVDWHDKRRLLKVAFPVDVLSRTATYEVQFGAQERPTHHSDSYARARFEVAGHRWIDISEGDYGVSLLNDCKYGFDTYQNTMRISLLRSAVIPDPKADEGHHEFTYSMYPHAGNWRQAETVRRAYELNAPILANLRSEHAGDVPSTHGFVSVDKPSVVIESVKKAEDSDAVIVRMYEAHGTRGPVQLSFDRTPVSVVECNLMEEEETPTELNGSAVCFDIAPWEIRTFKLVF
jgi:alpha-mannosidase